jgi:molybdopterin-containing oxidoreductase family membrane subunit
VFNVEGLYASMKRVIWIAIAALAGGILVLGLELGHPLRATYAIFLNFQTSSPLFWKPVFVFLYIFVLLASYLKVKDAGWSPAAMKQLGYALFITGGLLAAASAAVFGLMSMRPVWYDPMLPVFSIFESMILGLSGIVIAVSIGHGGVGNAPAPTRAFLEGFGRNGMALFTALVLLSVVARAWGGLWSSLDGLQVWSVIVRSPPFWVEIVALALALFLLLQGGSLLSSAVLVIVATFVGRYEFVIAGQMVPLFKGSWVPGLISYTPSLTEWMVALLGLAVNFAIYAFGEKQMDLSANPAS